MGVNWILNAQGSVEVKEFMGTELDVVNAARLMYDHNSAKFSDRDERFLKYLLSHNRMRPFEQVVFRLEIYAPTFVANEFFRDGDWNYSQVHRDKTDNKIAFYSPTMGEFRKESNTKFEEKFLGEEEQKHAYAILEKVHKTVSESFLYLRSMKTCLPQSISCLTGSTMTRFLAVVNLRQLIEFLRLKQEECSSYEVSEYCRAIREAVWPMCPTVFDHLFKPMQGVPF